MKITIEQIAHLLKKYPGLRLTYFDDIFLRGRRILQNDLLLVEHLDQLQAHSINEIEIYYNHTVYQTISYEFPAHFRAPFGKINLMQLDKELDLLRMINSQSKRKRTIRSVGDVYGIDPEEGRKAIVVRHDEELTYERLNSLKRIVNKDQYFTYRRSEVPIIIFVDLSKMATTNYVERFKKNTDLISILVTQTTDENAIAPDFVATEDVISVTDPDYLLDMYIKSNARLIIIGENINEAYKKALLQVKSYDKFVRMMVVPTIDHRNKDHFIKQVKLVYNSDRWNS